MKKNSPKKSAMLEKKRPIGEVPDGAVTRSLTRKANIASGKLPAVKNSKPCIGFVTKILGTVAKWAIKCRSL